MKLMRFMLQCKFCSLRRSIGNEFCYVKFICSCGKHFFRWMQNKYKHKNVEGLHELAPLGGVLIIMAMTSLTSLWST
jgi:hypothetical protein